MGEWADYARDQEELLYLDRIDEAVYLMEHDVWTTDDGREIHIKKMLDHHLLNVIAFLEGSGSVMCGADWLEKLKAEKARRELPENLPFEAIEAEESGDLF